MFFPVFSFSIVIFVVRYRLKNEICSQGHVLPLQRNQFNQNILSYTCSGIPSMFPLVANRYPMHWCLLLNNWVILCLDLILFSNFVRQTWNILVWNWPNAIDIWSALWILMPWCFSLQCISIVSVLKMPPWVFSSLGVNFWKSYELKWIKTWLLHC